MRQTCFLLLILILTSCGVSVVKFVNENAKFRSFESFALVGLKGQNVSSSADETELIQRLEEYVANEMTRRGYFEDLNEPDLIVRYEIISGARSTNPSTNGIYYTPPSSRQITESVILVEMTDFQTKKLVWQASLDLTKHTKLTKRRDALKSAVINIYNTYLYKAKSATPDKSLYIK